MPNWCENTLSIRSELPGAVRMFYQACKGKPANWGISDWELERIINPEDREEAIRKSQKEYDALPFKFCFNALVPVPAEVIATGYSISGAQFRSNEDGYNWCINHWGTKWDIYNADGFSGPEEMDIELTEDTTEIVCGFDTAWGPPDEWVKAAAIAFPQVELELEYFEPGMAFGGKVICKGNECQDITWTEEEVNAKMKEYGFLSDSEDWKEIYNEVTKEQAQALFTEGKDVYGIDEDGDASKIEIPEDLEDYDIFGTVK